MKRISCLCIVFLLGVSSQAISGDIGIGIGFNAGVSRLEGDLRDPNISPLISGHLRILPVPYLAISGEMGFSALQVNNHSSLPDFKTTIVPFELSAIFNFLPFRKVNPYIFAGGGGVYWKATNLGSNVVTDGDGIDSFLKTGGGLEFRVSPSVAFNLGATFRYSLTEAFDQTFRGNEKDQVLDVHAGLTYYFSKNKNDRDNDSIPDDLDLMPDIAEDRDGYLDHDGIPEKNPSPVALNTLDVPFSNGNKTDSPVVIHQLITSAESGGDITVKANIYSEIDLKVVATIYRVHGTPNWNVVRMQEADAGLYEGVIPGYAVATEGLEYCVVAVDETARGIGYAGLPSKPIRVKVAASGKLWRFVGGTAGAAAVGTASYIILKKQDK